MRTLTNMQECMQGYSMVTHQISPTVRANQSIRELHSRQLTIDNFVISVSLYRTIPFYEVSIEDMIH